jgi:hypothetical protein
MGVLMAGSNRTVTKCLGSCKQMSEAEALQKAKKMKAEAV